jgi:hypothetical protein
MHEASGVGKRHVAARQNVIGDCLAKDLDAEDVGNDLFSLTLEVGVDESDVVICADDVAKG